MFATHAPFRDPVPGDFLRAVPVVYVEIDDGDARALEFIDRV